MSVGKAGTEDIETLVKMRLSYLIVEKPMSPAFINGRTGMVLNVYTCPSYRRRGCAKIIMEVLLSEAKKMEISVIELKATGGRIGSCRADLIEFGHFMIWHLLDFLGFHRILLILCYALIPILGT